MNVSVPVHPEFPDDNMGVQISQKQSKLKKNDAGAPDKIAAAKPWQEYFGNDQLDLEEQKSGYKTECIEIVDFFHDTPHRCRNSRPGGACSAFPFFQ
jgi:hypothetical protein